MSNIALAAKMIQDCKNINSNYDFYDLVKAHTGNYICRDKYLYWFNWLWEYIPQEYLYQLYTELLSDIHILKGRSWYTTFFKPEILSKISKLNKNEIAENSTLNSLLDNKGFITVYLGHSKKVPHSCNSWAINKENAIDLGRIKTLFDKSNPVFYCITGKIKLDDIIAHINVRDRDEIIVLQKNVKNKTKEIFNSADVALKPEWTYWI